MENREEHIGGGECMRRRDGAGIRTGEEFCDFSYGRDEGRGL